MADRSSGVDARLTVYRKEPSVLSVDLDLDATGFEPPESISGSYRLAQRLISLQQWHSFEP
jgi:hypothetical protein